MNNNQQAKFFMVASAFYFPSPGLVAKRDYICHDNRKMLI
jgi:hypothetical protein